MPERDTGVDAVSLPATDRLIAGMRRRLRVAACSRALAAGLALAAAVLVIAALLGLQGTARHGAAGAAGIALTFAAGVPAWRRWTPAAVAAEVQRRAAGLDNLIVTAVDVHTRALAVHPAVLVPLHEQAEARAAALDVSSLAPVGGALALLAAAAVGVALVAWGAVGMPGAVRTVSPPADSPIEASTAATLTIVVTPPAYTDLPAATYRDVAEVDVLEGSHVRLEVHGADGAVQLIEAGRPTVGLDDRDETQSIELVVERTRFVLLRATTGGPSRDRLLAIKATPDVPPAVHIRRPARDLAFAEPRGRIAIEVEATDDFALSALSLRYIRASGSGESVTFQEGELPLRIGRAEPGRWTATGEISLEALSLEDGDTLVYRAISRDRRPGRDPSTSEAYLVEVGKATETASAGSALPVEKDRQAISQQMLIIKTERLHAARDGMAPAEVEEQARLLAVEQRMVRAEFVFMTGGEVEDEVAEAEHSHDLAEGRFENEAQVELFTAIREMSRAEARLNVADTVQALVFERSALKALQRAFDRRRYLLRTMPERARIDRTRRLTGELDAAQSWRRQPAPVPDTGMLERLEALATALAAARQQADTLPSLAARLAAIDPAAPDVQQGALALAAAAAGGAEARVSAVDEALRLIAGRAQRALAPGRSWVPHDPAAGRYADALSREGGTR